MINNLRFELSFKNIVQLEKKLKFCKSNKINNINIPCKGIIKKEFFNTTFEYINKNFSELDVVYHYSLFHQYTKNIEKSYQKLLGFTKICNLNKIYQILLVSGSNKRKNFDVINLLDYMKKEEDVNVKFGIAYNPYLHKYFNISTERERYEKKISSGLIQSSWIQFGTDLEVISREVSYLRKNDKYKKINLFGSLLIPSKQFVARFKFRPWKEVYIEDRYLNSLEDFYKFTKDLVDFYFDNNIIPVIETDFTSTEKLNYIQSLIK